MKKRILIILIFVFLLTGCHSKEEKMIGLRMYNAINEGNVQGVKEILEQEDVNLEKLPITISTGLRKRDRRALGFAMDGGISDKEVLKLLVENVAFLRESGQEWQVGGFELPDVWEHVCEMGNEESIGLLLKDGFQPTDEEIVAGYQSCNVSTLNALIKYKIPYDKIYQYEDENLSGYSELCYFQPELAEKMYTEIPDLEITPEIFENVALCGSTAFVKILLADMKNPTPETLAEALDACVVRGNLELVEALVERGADMNFVLNASDMSKHTVMHTATKGSSISILTYLKENGGDMTVKDGDGYTPKDYER